MVHTSKNVRLTVVLISAWTVIQTFLHIFWVLYGYLLSTCWIRPTHYDVVFVYLTYFYKQSCGSLHLRNDTMFLTRAVPERYLEPNETISNVLYYFLRDSLDNAVLPAQSRMVSRTEMYLGLLLIGDLVWMASAVCLLVGAFCKLRQKYLSILFYGPWLLCTVFVCFLDVVAAVHHGIDLIQITNYTSWLDFIGVTNSNDFRHYNEHPSASVIPAIPTTVLVFLLSRIFVVWLVNVICFFRILFLAIPDLFRKTIVKPRSANGRKVRFGPGDEINLTSSEARIRNWQLFYGAIEANSTMASNSPGTSASTSHDTSHNSAPRGAVGFEIDHGIHQSTLQDHHYNMPSTSSGVRECSGAVQAVNGNNVKVPTLNNHVPWSYITPEEQFNPYVKKSSRTSSEDANNYLVYRTKL